MIATILHGSPSFHAVNYNENKVSNGVARLVEMKNFGPVELQEKYSVSDLKDYLKLYSLTNSRIQDAQFHVALSPKKGEMTEDELLDFAHRYLHEMGYYQPGQPLLIYAHYDTDNFHLHIITSRVDPLGRKIDHNFERERSQQVIDKILGINVNDKVQKDYQEALKYSFSSLPQFRAILSTMGYSTYEKNEQLFVRRGGKNVMSVNVADIASAFKNIDDERKRRAQLRAVMKKYKDICASREELAAELKKKFGIDLVFFGKKDSPYGYSIVDHKNKTVFAGSRVMNIRELLDFTPVEKHLDQIDSFIDRLLAANPDITIREVNEKIKRHGRAYIKNGKIFYKGNDREVNDTIWNTLKENGRVGRARNFKPSSLEERDIICRLTKVSDPSRVEIMPDKGLSPAIKSALDSAFASANRNDIIKNLQAKGFRILRSNGKHYAVNFKSHEIVCLEKHGYTLPVKSGVSNLRGARNRVDTSGLKRAMKAGGSRDENREWELDKKGDYEWIDDENVLKY